MIEVLKGKKKYLPISMSAGFDLPYFRNGDTLNKNYIINKISGNEIYKEYIPEGIDLNKLSRKFILSVSLLILIFIIDDCILRTNAI